MKQYLLSILAVVCMTATAQQPFNAPWLQDLYQQKSKPTFDDIVQTGLAYWETQDKDARGSGYKPFMRWIERYKDCVEPDGTIQSNKELMTILAASGKSNLGTTNGGNQTMMDTSNWYPMGPFTHDNTGSWSSGQGRVNTLLEDPNNPSTLYVGTPAGGIWKSVDAGATWVPLIDELAQIGVSAIAIHPSDSNTIYIGTGDDDAGDSYSIGLWKSTDAGATWSPTGLTFNNDFSNINEVYINPNDANNILVSGSEGIHRSTDGGVTFTHTYTVESKDIKPKPGDFNTIYMSSNGRIMKSTDNGQNFTAPFNNGAPTNSSRIVLDVSPAAPNNVYAYATDNQGLHRGVYVSTNSGDNFSKVDAAGSDFIGGNSQAWYDLAFSVDDTDPNILYAGEVDMYKSTDGGVNWVQQTFWSSPFTQSYIHADIHQLRHINGTFYASTDGGIYRSTDKGVNFTSITDGIQNSQFYRIAVSEADDQAMIGGLQDNGGMTFDQNGNWFNYYGADGMDTAIDPQDPNLMYGFTQFGGSLYGTTNAGVSSNVFEGGAASGGNWITALVANSQGVLYAAYGRLFSIDKKNNGNWVALAQNPTGGTFDELEIDPNDDNTIYVTSGDRLYKSTDGGATVTLVYTAQENITSIEVNHNDSNIVYLVESGTNGRVRRSTNGGSTFISIMSGLPQIGKTVIKHQPLHSQNPLFLGTSLGVYRYDDTTSTWNLFENNLPNTSVSDLEISAQDGYVTASTYGRGIWRSNIPIEAPNDEIKLEALNTSGVTVDCTSTPLSVTLANQGVNPITAATLTIDYDGAVSTQTWNGNLLAGMDEVVPLSGLVVNRGVHTISVNVSGTADTYTNNNDRTETFFHNDAGSIGANDFENAADQLLTFNSNDNNTSQWVWETPSGAVLNSTGSGTKAYTMGAGDHANNTTAFLVSQCYDMTTIVNPILTLDLAFQLELDYDVLYMQYSNDAGGSWNLLGSTNDPNWYNSSTSTCALCVGAQWNGTQAANANMQTYTYDLSPFTAETNMLFRLVFRSDQAVTEEGAVVDNFGVVGTLSTSDEVIATEVAVYPNPSTGIFNLRMENAVDGIMNVYSMSGQLIKSQTLTGSNNRDSIDISDQATGIYLLEIATPQGRTTKRLIKQ